MPISIYDGTTWQKISSDVATKLANPRTITLSGVTATGQLFDGTADVTIPITAIPATLLTGTASINTTGSAGLINGTQNGVTTTIRAENSGYTHYKTTSTDGHYFNKDLVVNGAVYPYRENVSDVRNLGLSNAKWDNVYATTFNGNATSATVATSAGQLTSTRNITLTGMVSGTTTTNLSSDITINTNVQAATISNAGIVTTSDQSFAGAKHFPQGLSSYALEFTDIASTAGNGGYIDFHYNGSTSDYTSRIIEESQGIIGIKAGINISGNIQPATNNAYSLGTSSLKLSNVYATTFNGDLIGTSTSSDALKAYDNRAVATAPNDYSYNYKFLGLKNKTTIELDVSGITYAYLLGLRGYADPSGGVSHELAYTNNGIYHRMQRVNSINSNMWDRWYKILESHDTNQLVFGEKIQKFTNTSGTISIDHTNGHIIYITVSTATTIEIPIITDPVVDEIDITNYPIGAITLTFIIVNGGGKIIWPVEIKWADGTPPELTTTGTDVITILSLEAGNGDAYGVAATNFS